MRGVLVFYDTFLYLCNLKHIAPTAAVVEMGFQKSVATRWKNGTVPRDANLLKVADYFGVTVDYLLNGEIKKSPDVMSEDDELNEYLELLKNNPGMRTLFSKTKTATKEDLEKVIKMLDILRGTDNGGYFY